MANTWPTHNLFQLVFIFTTYCSRTNFNINFTYIPNSCQWPLLTLPTKFYLTTVLYAMYFQFQFFKGDNNFTPTKICISILKFRKYTRQKIVDWVEAHIFRIYFSTCYCYSKLPELCRYLFSYKMGFPYFTFINKCMALHSLICQL